MNIVSENLSGDAVPAESVDRFKFIGNAREYFGIWIVNILLTILTFGIYSAWAKVRRNRYFYGSTKLADRGFDYHATGGQLLIGRILVVVILLVYNVLLELYPIGGLVLTAVFIFALPWFVMRGLKFNARVTSYDNVRFDFVGGYGGAFVAYVIGPMVAAISFGLLAPYATRWSYRYIFDNLKYGQLPFSTDVEARQLYRAWYLPAMITVAGLALLIILGVAASSMAGSIEDIENLLGEMESNSIGVIGTIYLAFFALFISYGIAGLVYSAGARNIAYGKTRLDQKHRLHSDMPRGRFAWIFITNVLVTILTLGLMRPWAAVRMARFTADHTALKINGGIGDVTNAAAGEGSAMGSEYMDIEGIDIGF